MSLDLGDLSTLASALGLLDDGGNLAPDWFSRPGHYLAQVLREAHQRESLVTFAGDLLGGGQPVADGQGRQWLPVAHAGGGVFTVFAVIGPDGPVIEAGAGARLDVTSAGGVRCQAEVHVPLFGQPAAGSGAATVLIGSAAGTVDISLELTLPSGTQTAGVALGGARLTAGVPTDGTGPVFGLVLTGLQLPGAAAPADLAVTVTDLTSLEHSLIHLVMGLVQAEVSGLPATDPLRGLATMLGLVPGDVPAFPVEALLAHGPGALADWLAAALGGPAGRAAWLGGVAALVGGTVSGVGAAVQVGVTLGPAVLAIGIDAAAGASGRPRITPTLALSVTGAPGVTLALKVDPVSIDLGTGAAVAVPALRLTGQLRGSSGGPLLPAIIGPAGLSVEIDGLDAGFALDPARRPTLVLQALNATVGASQFAVLDLSSPDALAAAAQDAVAGAAGSLLRDLGPAAVAAGVLLGLSDPPGGPVLPKIDPVRLLSDPLGALRAYWDAALTAGQAEVQALLEVLRDAVADATQSTVPVSGTGTASDPWLLPLTTGANLSIRYADGVLAAGLAGTAGTGDLAGTGIAAALTAQVQIAELGLSGAHAGRAAFLSGASGELRFTKAGGGAMTLGEPPVALTATAAGIGVTWSTGTGLATPEGAPAPAGLRLVPVAQGVALLTPAGQVALPELGPGTSAALADEMWAAVEQLVAAGAAALAGAAGATWPLTVVNALGWGTSRPGAGVVSGPYLSLADLVADPAAALRAEAVALADVTEGAGGLLTLLNVLAELAGAPVARLGSGQALDPWRLPLLGDAVDAAAGAMPALFATVEPTGPEGPATLLQQGVANWQPGDPDLAPETLISALATEAGLDPDLADLLTGRGDVLTGLDDLTQRWLGTDGLVTLPGTGLPDGVTGHQIPDLAHPTPLGALDLAAVDGLAGAAAAATVVHIAVVTPGLPVVLAAAGADGGPAADHALDLTAAGRAPASFGPPPVTDPAGLWTVALGPRAVCQLDTGDPDGVAGQAARLAAVLPGLVAAAGGPVLVVAHGAAGHPAVRAATGLAGVAAVVTVGTPWTPVTADTLDQLPGAESLRLLAGLVPAVDPDEPDDPDLALARALTGLWLSLDPLGDPLAELRPPAGPTVPAGGTPVHALAGALTADTVGRALTAAVAAGLSVRAAARAQAPTTATGARAGLRLPLLPPLSRAGLTCAVHVDLELGGFELGGLSSSGTDTAGADASETGATGPTITRPAIVISLDLGSVSGWLVGGPDPGRTAGTARPLALRRLTARVRLPLAGIAAANATGTAAAAGASSLIVLHDATAFGVRVPRWNVAAGPDAPDGATTALPEVRALLAEVATRIGQAAAGTGGTASDPVLAGLRDGLAAIGLLSAGGATGTAAAAGTALGIDPVTLDRLVLDPGGVAAAVRADTTRRPALAAALRALAGDARTATAAGETVALSFASGPSAVTATFDLAGGGAQVTASGPGGAAWGFSAGISRSITGAATASIQLRIGIDLPAPGVPGAPAQGAALLLDAGTGTGAGPFTLRVRTAVPSGLSDLTLWPAPDPAAITAALESTVPVALLTAALAALRTRLTAATGGSAATGELIDAVADALGLLGAAPPLPPGSDPGDPQPARPLRLPAGLLADPGGWLRSLTPSGGTLAATVPALLDALRGVVTDPGGGPGTPGVLPVAPGLALRAAAVDGRLVLAADVDGTAFTPGGAVGQLVLGGSAGLSLDPAGGGPRPDVTLSLTVTGIGAIQFGVGPRADGTVGVTLSVHPDGGVDIPILPAGPGLGASAIAGAAMKALPALLDTLAEQDPAGDPTTVEEIAGRVVAKLGDALGLRTTGAPARFDAAALSTFGHDPAAALAARAPAIAAQGLSVLADAISPLLGTSGTHRVTTAGAAVVVTVGPVTLTWAPGSARIGAGVTVPSGLPGMDSLAASVTVDATGLTALDVAVGPASLAAGPLTIRPFARVVAGSAPPGGRAVEIGLGAGTDSRLVARIPLGGGAPSLISRIGPAATATDSTDPGAVILAALGAVLDLAGSVVLAVGAVAQGLDRPLLGTTARTLLSGVLLDPAHPDHLDPSLLDPSAAVGRLGFLLRNLAAAPGATITLDGALTLGPHARSDGSGGTVYGLRLGLSGPWSLGGDDITVSLEPDAAWIVPPPAGSPGITVEVLSLDAAGHPAPAPGIGVDGVAVRLARASGALLDSGITIESVALSLFADILGAGGTVTASGGAKLELAGLSAALGGASGGDNAVAGGLVNSGSHDDAPKPRFSPALAVQKHGTDAAFVTFTAGDGTGPWWVVIQRGFGPIYIEQVGLAVTMAAGQVGSVGLLIDGQVSLLGLTASVDDLSITYLVSMGSPLDPHAWAVDLAGLAVTADLGGLSLAGGLRKFPVAAGGVQYLGMLLAKLAVYGISVYGGYGLVGPPGDQYASLFLFGAVNGPIGGPPAFFVTGIGGGFGINRDLIYPSDLTQFPAYPFIKALDPAARPGDPMTELDQVRGFFPPDRGSFWFAAGLSFTSFALVDGVAVVAVQIGDGFELALLGLARMALPRPQAALVSIELALLARVSTKEGVVLVQAALTDNSWLLYPDIRLTGGFAFASWFGGPNRGQMVLTLGGYHPDFHHDGYPVVPRLGLSINLFGFLSITGQTYFALTSEAIMAGVAITASADFGIAWAHLRFGGDGIIFYDPFFMHISVYASISAGITIDVWIGTISISVSLSAQVDVYAPPFYGEARFSVGPSTLTVPFGDQPPQQPAPGIAWAEFVTKYLQEASAGIAHVLGAITGPGAQVPAGSAAAGGARSPDGSDASPFLVTPEFTLTVTSLAPVRELVAGGTTTNLPTVPEVSAAPMRQPARPTVTLAFIGPAHASPQDRIAALALGPQADGSFPVGVWGPAQTQDDAKVPSGAVITAVDRVQLTGAALWAPSPAGAPDIPLRQVETGSRRPLPFVTEGSASQLAVLSQDAGQLAATVPAAGPAGVLATASDLLRDRGGRSPADVAAWKGGQRAQPILGSLGEGLGTAWAPAAVGPAAPPVLDPIPLRRPAVQAVLAVPVGLDPVPTVMVAAAAAPSLLDAARADSAPGAGRAAGDIAERAAQIPVTTVVLRGPGPTTSVAPGLLNGLSYVTSAPPVLASVDSGLTPAIPAQLILQPDPALAAAGTVLSAGLPPVSRSGRSGTEAVDGRGGGTAGRAWLAGLTASLHGDPAGSGPGGNQGDGQGGLTISAGQVTVLHAPDADRDVNPQARPALTVVSGTVRVVAVGPGAGLLLDQTAQAGGEVLVPPGTRVLAVHTADPPVSAAAAASTASQARVYGWDPGAPLPYLGDEVLLTAGGIVVSAGRVPWRRYARTGLGWVSPGTLTGGASAITTRFSQPVDTVAVAVEGGSGDDLALGLSGATRPRDGTGQPVPPVLVADGPRAVAVYAIVPDTGPDGTATGIDVTVATGPGRHLAGVAGSASSGADGGAAGLAAAIAARGFAAVVPDPVPTGLGRAVVAWKQT